jgi:hypothetical protein
MRNKTSAYFNGRDDDSSKKFKTQQSYMYKYFHWPIYSKQFQNVAA